MEDMIRDLVCKNQDIEKGFAYKTHVLEIKTHELENTNAQLQARQLELEGNLHIQHEGEATSGRRNHNCCAPKWEAIVAT